MLFIYPKFSVSSFVFSSLLTYVTATFLAKLKGFLSLTPSSGKRWVSKYSTDYISVMVPLLVATWSVTMDTWYLQRLEYWETL